MATVRQRFDAAAIVAAVDAQRQARGLSWSALKETGVSPSTIRNFADGAIVEMDGVLWVTAWLDRSVESFYRGARPDLGPRHRRGDRIDVPGLHGLIDARRRAEGLTWEALAVKLSLSSGVPIGPSGLTRMRGGGRVDLYHTLALCEWLGRPVASIARNLGW